MPEFYTVITDSGLRSLALATSQGQKLSLTHAVVGDGKGALVTPSKDMTSLEREVWRGNVSGVHSTEAESNTLIFEFVIKADVGGFTIREVGLLDENGNLFCIGNFPETEKPVVTDGSVRDLVIRLPLHFENAENVNLIIDTNVAVATKQDVLEHNTDPLAHGILKSDAVDLDSSEKVATSKAVKITYDNLTAHKADSSAHGIVKSDAVNSASSDFATSKAVKTTHDSLTAHKADTAVHGIVKSDAVNSSSSDFATSKAVKTVHDQLSQHSASVNTHGNATTSAKGFVRLGTANEHVAHTSQSTSATPYGVWKLIEAVKSDDTGLNSSVKLATSKAIKTTQDSLTAHKADTAAHGIVKSSAVSSSSTSQIATSKAVKTVNDLVKAHANDADIHSYGIRGGIELFDGVVNSAGRPIDAKTGQPNLNYGLCDGRTYAAPDGRQVTTPDMRDRFPVGAGASYELGAKGGAASVTQSSNQLAVHTHNIKIRNSKEMASLKGVYLSSCEATASTSSYSYNTGGGEPMENRPPYIGTFFIKYL